MGSASPEDAFEGALMQPWLLAALAVARPFRQSAYSCATAGIPNSPRSGPRPRRVARSFPREPRLTNLTLGYNTSRDLGRGNP